MLNLRIHNVKLKITAAFAAAILFAGCFQDPMSAQAPNRPGKEGDVYMKLYMSVEGVNKLSKGNAITLNKLIVELTSNGTPADTVRDTIVSGLGGISSNSSVEQTINKNYSLKALRTWKIKATVRDTRDSVVHHDSATTPTLYAADTAAISLNLTSRFAMYEAKFMTIPDSINSASGTFKQKLNLNRLVLKIDGVTVRDSSVAPGNFASLVTHTLAYDYVSTGTKTAVNSGSNFNLNAVHFSSATKGFAVGVLGTIARTLDGGATWATMTVPTGKTLRAVYFLNQDTGWAAGDSVVYRTTNGGTSWNIHTTAPFLNTTSIRGVYFRDASNGIVTTANSSTYKTTNGGATWTIGTGIPAVYSLDAFNDTLWAAQAGGVVRHSSDHGASWTSRTTGAGTTLRGISAPSNSIVFAVGDGGKIARTTNGGANWSVHTASGAPNLLSVHFLDVATGFAVGENGVILSTNDTGSTWTVESTPSTQHLNAVGFFGGKGFIAGNGGTLLTLSGPKLVEMLAYGPMGNWNTAQPLFSGSKYVHARAGDDATIHMTLNWVGPTTGTGAISATLGRVGKITIIGTLPGTTFP